VILPVATARARWINLRPSAGFAGATPLLGEVPEGGRRGPLRLQAARRAQARV